MEVRTDEEAGPGPLGEANLGTRFLVYPQAPHVPGYATPELVWIMTDPSGIQPGPADDRIYVSDPALDKDPYEFPYLPPFAGAAFPPAEPGPDGHFDHLDPSSRQFVSAHAYAAVRRVIDIWESYLGRRIGWHFADTYERLEIIPWLNWENAQSGYGFLELGVEHAPDGNDYPFALNFDTIAHEVGHSIQFSLFGVPEGDVGNSDFGPFHEASADLVSLLSFLHFDTGVDRLLRRCQGNLLSLNELNRIVELTGERQLRLASNARKLSEVTHEIHDRSRPFTGAVFDAAVETFHRILVENDLADERLLAIDLRDFDESVLDRITEFTSAAFKARPFLFKSALVEARDQVGIVLARTWDRVDPSSLTFASAALTMVEAADEEDAELATCLEDCFAWREIL
jgi:hypothetical protein